MTKNLYFVCFLISKESHIFSFLFPFLTDFFKFLVKPNQLQAQNLAKKLALDTSKEVFKKGFDF